MATSGSEEKARKSSKKVKVDFGLPGAPMNHSHPFYFGFLAVSGGLLALTLLRSLASASVPRLRQISGACPL